MRYRHEVIVEENSDGGFGEIANAIAFAADSRRSATHRLQIRLAGRLAELVVVGQELAARILPVFAHLAETSHPGAASNSTIAFLDAEAAEFGPVPAPVGGEWVMQGEGWRLSAHRDARYLAEARSNSLICLDRATGSVAALFQTASSLSLADRSRPLQRMMSQICSSYDAQNVHAALVACGGVGVLIVGGSGRGKTSTSIDCLMHGLDFLGDDSVAIGEAESGRFRGFSLYGSACILPEQLDRWPEIRSSWHLPARGDEKAMLLPGRISAERVALECEIAAIVVPRITDGVFRATRTSPRTAFSALVHDSEESRRFQMSPAEFHRLARLTRETPCFLCELDTDPDAVADGVLRIIQGLSP